MAKNSIKTTKMGEIAPQYDNNFEEYRLRTEKGIPFIGISRHRIGIDGKGITTLVAFHGCPLQCKFCLNPQTLGKTDGLPRYKPENLLKQVGIDDIYFRATGGGICFGGGEPLSQSDFIVQFKKICLPEWKLSIETSLNGSYKDLKDLAPIIDHWIIDIKSLDDDVYKKYTGQKDRLSKENLKSLVDTFGVSKDKITLRVPIIPGFVSEEEAKKSAEDLRKDFPNVEVFKYETKRPDNPSLIAAANLHGKQKCDLLKSIRKKLAQRNGIPFSERPCSHIGDCPGTCPLCDYELKQLTSELNNRGINDFKMSQEIENHLYLLERSFNHSDQSVSDDNHPILEGADAPYEYWENLEKNKNAPENGNVNANLNEGEVLDGAVAPFENWTPNNPAQFEMIRKKVLFKECAVAGVSFHIKYDDEIWNELGVGAKVVLVREKNNKYDKNAVAIALADDYDGDPDDFDFDFIIGYVPKSDNAEIAQLLDMGWQDVFVAELTTVKTTGNLNDRLRVSIFIQSKDPEYLRPNRLRAMSLNTLDLRKLVEELNEKGTAYFRFGGYPPFLFQMPEVGEKIVMVHRDIDSEVLFLMRVLAKDDDCDDYLDLPYPCIADDDCAPFILTNVMGPLRINKSDYQFLSGVDLKGFSPTEYLPEDLSNGFERLFMMTLLKTINRNNVDSDPSIDKPKDVEVL